MQKDLALLGLRTTLGSILLMHACDKLALHSISVLFKDDLADHINEAVYPFSMVVQFIFPFFSHDTAQRVAELTCMAELAAGACLFLGVFCRIASIFMVIMLSVAIYYHAPYGFFGKDGGYEWAMLCLGGCFWVLYRWQ